MTGDQNTGLTVPVLCKFWLEDGVWNGVAEHMAVAVFGTTFEEAIAHMRDAIESHFQCVLETGDLDGLVKLLQEQAKEYGFLTLDEISPGSPFVKMQVAIRGREIVAVT